MKPNYFVLDVDTTAAQAGLQLLAPGNQYDSITVLQIPAGLVASLAFGANGANKFVPILNVLQEFSFEDVCGNPFQVDEGLFINHNAVVGVLRLLVSIGGNQPTS